MATTEELPASRVSALIEAVEHLRRGDYQIEIGDTPHDPIGDLGRAIQELALALQVRSEEGGQQTGVLGQANSEMSRAEMMQEYNRLDELKDRFLGMAAHDLRNPLSAMKMALSYLADPSRQISEEMRQHFLRTSLRQVDFMTVLLDDILYSVEIQSGSFRLKSRRFSINSLIGDTLKHHVTVASKKTIQIVFEKEKPDPEIRADPVRIRQVMDNLISNAVKYSPPGSRVTVSARREGCELVIHVRDEGPGILPQERARLFQDFTRLSAEPTGGEQSTGLGLSIVRRIVEAHHGRVGVTSEPGQGADFWFALPEQYEDFTSPDAASEPLEILGFGKGQQDGVIR